jgi:L-alanine-DL-glutamate epimerase-like enolase superfamily enzyme
MKITDVQAILMSCPLPDPLVLPFYNGRRTILKRDAMLIRVKTDTNLVGYAPGPAHERAAREIRDIIRPFLIGRDPRLFMTFKFQNNPEVTKTYYAVEVALADLAGKHGGQPISELIGGVQRDRIKLYGSAGMYMSPESYAEEAAAIAAMGFRAYKMRPALGPDEDVRTVELMRRAVGPDLGLMVDAHSWWRMGNKSYSEKLVGEVAGAIAGFSPTWLEEPLPPDDHAAYQRLHKSCPVPLATGEHEQTREGFRDLIKNKAADYIQMDVCCQGGFGFGHQILVDLSHAGLKFAFHSWGTALEVLAAAHLGVCFRESVAEWLEYPCYANNGRVGMYPFPLADEILAELLQIENGDLILPRGPGLGIDVNERVIDKYPFIPGPWSIFQIDSPPETVAVTGDHSLKWEPLTK